MYYNGGVLRVNPTIFRAYDIRGVPGKDFDMEFAQRLGSRAASYLSSKSFGSNVFVVGRDGRRASDDLAHAVIDGALHVGAQVIDVGEVSSPQFYWAVRMYQAAGGVMVTASHNPEQYDGFKVVRRHDQMIEVIGGHHLRQIYDSHAHRHQGGGGVVSKRIAPDYAAAVAYAASWEGAREIRCALDAPPAVYKVLAHLGQIAPDDRLAVRMDSDADRITFYIDGVAVPAEHIFLLLAEKLELHPVVFDLRFSRVVSERLDQLHVPYTTSAVGRVSMTEAMHAQGAMMGGETSGHVYWRAMGGMECPEVVLLQVLNICGGDAGRLSDMLAPYRKYAKSEEVNIPIRDRKHARQIIERIEKHYPKSRLNHTDGLLVDNWDDAEGWWFNIRMSNTEPLMRLVVESKKEELLERRVQEVRHLAG